MPLRIRTILGLAVVTCVASVNMASAVDVFNMPAGQKSLEMVPVGDVGNAADTTGYGSVNYSYSIGKYDVTAGQYTAFLNAVAVRGDPLGLYNWNMSKPPALTGTFDVGCGIIQSCSQDGYIYSIDDKHQNYPVNYVTFWDACRFTNWIQNNQPSGPEGVSVTGRVNTSQFGWGHNQPVITSPIYFI